MNDFTKEELFDLESCVIFWCCTGNKDKEYLKEKLQSMIGNYCEHRWYSGGNRPWLHCIKCKENFHHEPQPY